MKVKIENYTIFSILILIVLSTSACGINYNVKGRVVDAKTNKPIEGASIAIHWIGWKIGPPYASGAYTLKKAKDISDRDGYFKVPRYFLKSVYMGVYKKGYVCWHNRSVFLKGIGIKDKDRIEDRIGFKVRSGMVAKLEPFTDEYPRAFHSSFVVNISRVSGGLTGIGEEVKFYRKYYWNK